MQVLIPNATLTAINAAGSSEGYRDDDPAGAEKWSGAVGVNVQDKQVFAVGGQEGSATIARVTALVLPGELPKIDVGDVLTYEYSDEVHQRAVQDVGDTVFFGERTTWNVQVADG